MKRRGRSIVGDLYIGKDRTEFVTVEVGWGRTRDIAIIIGIGNMEIERRWDGGWGRGANEISF